MDQDPEDAQLTRLRPQDSLDETPTTNLEIGTNKADMTSEPASHILSSIVYVFVRMSTTFFRLHSQESPFFGRSRTTPYITWARPVGIRELGRKSYFQPR